MLFILEIFSFYPFYCLGVFFFVVFVAVTTADVIPFPFILFPIAFSFLLCFGAISFSVWGDFSFLHLVIFLVSFLLCCFMFYGGFLCLVYLFLSLFLFFFFSRFSLFIFFFFFVSLFFSFSYFSFLCFFFLSLGFGFYCVLIFVLVVF